MKKKVLEALKGSIAKWEGIVAGTIEDKGSDNCPLCKIFFKLDSPWRLRDDSCVGCPVYEETGSKRCSGTPYEEFVSIYDPWVNDENREYAVAEVEFLKSLLPNE